MSTRGFSQIAAFLPELPGQRSSFLPYILQGGIYTEQQLEFKRWRKSRQSLEIESKEVVHAMVRQEEYREV